MQEYVLPKTVYNYIFLVDVTFYDKNLSRWLYILGIGSQLTSAVSLYLRSAKNYL